MDDITQKQRYLLLKRQLYSINSKLTELGTISDNLVSNLKESLLIDDDIIETSNINNLNNNRKDIKQEIVTKIIPYLNNKI